MDGLDLPPGDDLVPLTGADRAAALARGLGSGEGWALRRSGTVIAYARTGPHESQVVVVSAVAPLTPEVAEAVVALREQLIAGARGEDPRA